MEGLMLKLNLMLGRIEGGRRREQWSIRWLDSIADSMDMDLSKLQEAVDRRVWCTTLHGRIELDMT